MSLLPQESVRKLFKRTMRWLITSLISMIPFVLLVLVTKRFFPKLYLFEWMLHENYALIWIVAIILAWSYIYHYDYWVRKGSDRVEYNYMSLTLRHDQSGIEYTPPLRYLCKHPEVYLP